MRNTKCNTENNMYNRQQNGTDLQKHIIIQNIYFKISDTIPEIHQMFHIRSPLLSTITKNYYNYSTIPPFQSASIIVPKNIAGIIPQTNALFFKTINRIRKNNKIHMGIPMEYNCRKTERFTTLNYYNYPKKINRT